MSKRSIPWLSLLAVLALLPVLFAPALAAPAEESGEPLGDVPALTASNMGNGSLTDDSPLGLAAADAAAASCGADLALLCGGDLAGNLLPGPVTWEKLRFAFAADPALALCTVSPAQLRELLEFCLSRMTVDEHDLSIDREASAFAAFPQVAGFTVKYDVSAPIGSRVTELTALDGTDLLSPENAGAAYLLVSTEPLLSGSYGPVPDLPRQPAGMTVCQALADFIAAGRMTDYSDADRVRSIGSTDSSLVRELGLNSVLLPVCIIAALALGAFYRAKSRRVQPELPTAD